MEVKQTPSLHRDWIDPHAYGIVKALQKQGYTTYLVGGCVRDLLLGKHPKDFDIATTARPNEVKKIIYNSYVIGRRFRLVLVKREEKQYEVATFRRNVSEDDDIENLPPGDNLFGSPEEDALRRDFTINGLFYDPVADKLIDWTGGLKDLKAGIVRMIGNPNERLIEDPIRILRAIRLTHMIQFHMESDLKKAISQTAPHLTQTPVPRRREEWLKFLRLKDPSLPFLESYDLQVLQYAAPHLHKAFADPTSQEILLSYLYKKQEILPQEPYELFGLLILAYIRAQMSTDPLKPITSKTMRQHTALTSLMKDELGMFKYEQETVLRAIHFIPQFPSVYENRTKKTQRLNSFARSQSFPLALQMAKAEHLFSPEELLFWTQQYEKRKNL